MRFNVTPLTGIDEIQFGMSLDEARNAISSSYNTFKRTPAAEHPCDFYENLGLFVYYDSFATVEALEFCEPALLYFKGINLVASSFEDIVKFLKSIDNAIELEGDSFTSYSLGIGGYSPDLGEDSNSACESVILFKDGYYD
ncbi:hypothetical protein P4S60_01645 [Pseudoalteromonas sp. Hal040]|uniref:hypothetical protein n=1 Tax=unclassified Pseudoalteromonas TaxID=194690 RepID=UPI00301E60B8